MSDESMPAKKKDLNDRFYDVLEMLFKELDQEAIRREVEALRAEKPKLSREKLAQILIRRSAIRTASWGAAAGAAGGAIAIIAMAPDIFNLVREQSRLILSIAFLYDQQPSLRERFREVLAVLAVSTGASAARRGVTYLIRSGVEKKALKSLAKRIGGKYLAKSIPRIAPVIGGVIGAGVNYMAVQGVGKTAIEYYSGLADATPPKALPPAPSESGVKPDGEPAAAASDPPAPKKRAARKASRAVASTKRSAAAGTKRPARKGAAKKVASKKSASKSGTKRKAATKRAPAKNDSPDSSGTSQKKDLQ